MLTEKKIKSRGKMFLITPIIFIKLLRKSSYEFVSGYRSENKTPAARYPGKLTLEIFVASLKRKLRPLEWIGSTDWLT